MLSTPVLIVGGGPAGLASAAELAFHGIASVVVEPRKEVSQDRPRAKTTSARTMEHFRRWGISHEIRAAAALTPQWSDRVMFCTSVSGDVITSFSNVFGLGPETLKVSPELGQQIPQPLVEQVLREHLSNSPLITFRYGSRVSDITESVTGVSATIISSDGAPEAVEAAYLLGCDGATSAVRKTTGIRYVGTSAPRPNFNVLFRTTEIDPPMGNAVHYWVVGGDTPGVIGRLNLQDLWWLIAPGVEEADGQKRISEIVTSLVGHPIEHEIVSTDSWTARLLVADRFQTDRVFLVGESAHLNPPWGGHGFNTSVGDAVNIGWKIAAVLNGWAEASLLESYETERKPIAEQTIAIAVKNMSSLPADLAGPEERADAAAVIQKNKDSEFHSLGLVLGYSYAAGGLSDPVHYKPSSDPGGRLPHALYEDGTPLFDALGPEFTLISPPSTDLEQIRKQANELRMPLTFLDSPHDYPWAGDILLVRPDQHIAVRASSVHDIDLASALRCSRTVPEIVPTS